LESEFIGHLKLKLDLLGVRPSINSGHLRVRVMLGIKAGSKGCPNLAKRA